MATYKAISAGNADTLAIWNTWNGAAWVAAGSLPSTSDDVYTNNFIVTVTTSQSYLSWNRSSVGAPYNIAQGGQFQIDGSNDILISGEIYGTNAAQTANSPLSACVNRLATHTGTLSIVGNQNGGSGQFSYAFFNNSIYEILSIIGNQNGGSGGYASHGFYNKALATFTSIVGNQNGGSGVYAYGFYNNASATFTSIVGNQNGGSGAYANGFNNDAYATFTSIVGNQNGGSGAYAYGFCNNTVNINIEFQGNAYASGVAAIYNTQPTSTIIYEGNVYNNLAVMAIRSDRIFLKVTPTTVWQFSDFDGDTQYLYGAGVNTGHPIEADVRKDTVYGPNDEFEGTLAVPPPATVNLGVPVDATVGTWAFDAELITRLQNCSTVEITGQQIANFQQP